MRRRRNGLLRALLLAVAAPLSFTPDEGWNSWEDLRLDLAEGKRCIENVEDDIIEAERVDADTAGGLRRLLEDEKKHREAILDMLMRSDPQAVRRDSGID